jgi:hypothetical protein
LFFIDYYIEKLGNMTIDPETFDPRLLIPDY